MITLSMTHMAFSQKGNAHRFQYMGKFGVIDRNLNTIVEPTYKWINDYHYSDLGYTLFEVDGASEEIGQGNYGVLNEKGQIVLESLENKPNILGHYAIHFTNQKELLGLRIYDLETGQLVIENDSLRAHFIIKSSNPIFVLRGKEPKYYFYNDKGELLLENNPFWEISGSDENCPVFKTSLDNPKENNFKAIYFDCHGNYIEIEDAQVNHTFERINSSNLIIRKPHRKSRKTNVPEKINRYRPADIDSSKLLYLKQKFEGYNIRFILTQGAQTSVIATKNRKEYGLFDTEGQQLLPLEFSDIDVKGAWVLLRKTSIIGLSTISGEEVLPVSFLQIDSFGTVNVPYDFTVSTHSGYWGYALSNGKCFLPKEAFE